MSYAHAIKHTAVYRHTASLSGVTVLNTALALLALSLLTYYVMQANVVAADIYKIKSLREQLLVLEERNTALLAEKAVIEDPSAIQAFAQQHNMVSAGKDVLYLSESNDVALGNAR